MRLIIRVAVIATVGILAGCTIPAATPAPITTTPQTSSPPPIATPTPTPTPTSQWSADQQAAMDDAKAALAARDKLWKKPTMVHSASEANKYLAKYYVGQAYDNMWNAYVELVNKELHMEGTVQITKMSAGIVGPRADGKNGSEATVSVCVASKARLVDKKGKTYLTVQPQETGTYTMRQTGVSPNWLIAEFGDEKEQPCNL